MYVEIMSDYISLEGPLEVIDGQLMLLIPLEAGGDNKALQATAAAPSVLTET